MKTKLLSILAAALLITGVGNHKAEANDGQIFGVIIGAATGGFIGSHVGNGDGRLAATAAGTLIGALIGNEIGTSTGRDYRHTTVHRPVRKRPVVYRPVYAAPRPHQPARKVVIYKKTVIVKHVHDDRRPQWNDKRWKKHQKQNRIFEKRRRQQTRDCYNHPRRCARAF